MEGCYIPPSRPHPFCSSLIITLTLSVTQTYRKYFNTNNNSLYIYFMFKPCIFGQLINLYTVFSRPFSSNIFRYVLNGFNIHHISQNFLSFLIILQIITFINNIKNIYTCKFSFLLIIIVIVTSVSTFVVVMLNGFDVVSRK